MRKGGSDIKLYNLLFPLWLILMFPLAWIVVLPANFLIDSLVLIISMAILKITDKKLWYKRYILKIFCFGMLSDIVASAFMFVMVMVFEAGLTGDELYLSIPSILIASALIFILNYFVTFRKIDKRLRFKLSMIFATVTAPYTFLVQTSWLY